MEWSQSNNALVKTFAFPSFQKAMEFVNQVAALAEARAHHPDMHIAYHQVHLRLTTHDAGSVVTEKDWKLARAVDRLFAVD